MGRGTAGEVSSTRIQSFQYLATSKKNCYIIIILHIVATTGRKGFWDLGNVGVRPASICMCVVTRVWGSGVQGFELVVVLLVFYCVVR